MQTKQERPLVVALQQMSTVLHDLCQPLTNLQCRLEVAQLIGSGEEYRQAVETGVAESARLAGHVQSLRELLRGALSESAKSED